MSDFSKPVLAFESSLGGCVGAVIDAGGKTLAQFSFETDRDQAAKLIPGVNDIMKQAGVEFAALGLIVTTIGPGSFTGLRIGLSAARAMGLSLGLPVQGVGTLEAMAQTCGQDAGRNILVMLESKREDFYVQAFDASFKELTPPACLNTPDILSIAKGQESFLCGDGVTRFLQEAGDAAAAFFSGVREQRLLDPAAMARAGLAHFVAAGQAAAKPEPLYLRGADVSLSNKTQRQISQRP